MRLRIAFYKAQWGKPIDTAIALWTGLWNWFTPAYSHVEIGFEVEPDNWMYCSSTMRDKAKGPRWIKEKDLFKHPERWDTFDLIPCRDVQRMNKQAHEIINSRFGEKENLYDLLGILGFLTLFGTLNDKDKYYCSEFCWIVFTGEWKKRISPRRMYANLRDLI